LDPLRKFKIEEKDGGVWVVDTSEKELKENRRTLNIKCQVKSEEKKEKVVIVGVVYGGRGGVKRAWKR
jgi:preprotein translocase subunit SecB